MVKSFGRIVWPFEFVEFESRRFVGRGWFPAGDGMYDEIEDRAAMHARIRGVEIDVIEAGVFPSGRIASRERIGMRVRPVEG